jgi:Astacin (Peptidase family M12A)
MSKLHRICYDRLLPRELYRAPDVPKVRRADGVVQLRAIMPRGKTWPVASKLQVRFLGGTAAQQQLVKRFAPTWSEFANLDFVFDESPQAAIRISFDADDGAWSYIGTDCNGIPLNTATMNLGWQDEAVILHEFGHAIGMAHEHQNPKGGIEWNEEVVIRDLGGAPNFWPAEQARHNVIEKYTADQINGSDFDPASIMLYAFPGTWTKSGVGTKENTSLSALDKQFISSGVAYPGRTGPVKPVVQLGVTEVLGATAAIGQPGEEDLFSFQATKPGQYTIQTEGGLDVLMKLFGPDSSTQFITEDDDSGLGSNARISAELLPGKYFIQVRHFDPAATGSYQIKVFS